MSPFKWEDVLYMNISTSSIVLGILWLLKESTSVVSKGHPSVSMPNYCRRLPILISLHRQLFSIHSISFTHPHLSYASSPAIPLNQAGLYLPTCLPNLPLSHTTLPRWTHSSLTLILLLKSLLPLSHPDQPYLFCTACTSSLTFDRLHHVSICLVQSLSTWYLIASSPRIPTLWSHLPNLLHHLFFQIKLLHILFVIRAPLTGHLPARRSFINTHLETYNGPLILWISILDMISPRAKACTSISILHQLYLALITVLEELLMKEFTSQRL